MRPLRLLVVLTVCLALAGCRYLEALSTDPSATPTEDVAMNAAIRKARATLDVFTASLEARSEDQLYFAVRVRVPIDDTDGYEDVWLENLTYDGERFTGTLGNTPMYLEGAKIGDELSASADQVVDWMIVEQDRIVGGFVMRVQRERMTLRERIDFQRNLGLPIVDPD